MTIRLDLNLVGLYMKRRGFKWPFDRTPVVHIPPITWENVFSREEWDAYQYNPPAWSQLPSLEVKYPVLDDLADFKPSWDHLLHISELVKAEHSLELNLSAKYDGRRLEHRIDDFTDAVADRAIDVDGAEIHVGSGIEHLDGLHYLHSRMVTPGVVSRRSILRDGSGAKTRDVWTREELQQILDATVEQTDRAESARNIVVANIHLLKKKVEDGLKEADAVRTDPSEFNDKVASVILLRQSLELALDTVAEDIVKKAEELKSDTALPTDVPTLRRVLLERLGSCASQMQADITSYDSGQSAPLRPSCVDQASALTEVGKELQVGQAALTRADTVDGLVEAYTTAKSEIEAVRVVRRPRWRGPKNRLLGATTETYEATAEEAGDTFVFRCEPPDDKTDTGFCYIRRVLLTGPGSYSLAVPGDNNRAHELTVAVTGPGEVRLKTYGHNLCGPSPLVITITVPEEGGEDDE